MNVVKIKHALATFAKKLYYGRKGEPYRVGGRCLRYTPGTRPVRIKYVDAADENASNDARQVKLLTTSLREGDTAIDIGAHAGQYTLLMSAFCGHTGQVISFEPDPYARKLLLANCKLNPDTKAPKLEAFACSDTSGESILFSRGGNSQSSLAKSAVDFGTNDTEVIKIQTVTLDEYLASSKWNCPTWLKIDAEGAEIRILKGATQLLAGPTHIICELHPYAWAEFGNTYDELKAIVAKADREIRLLATREVLSDAPFYTTVLLERIERLH